MAGVAATPRPEHREIQQRRSQAPPGTFGAPAAVSISGGRSRPSRVPAGRVPSSHNSRAATVSLQQPVPGPDGDGDIHHLLQNMQTAYSRVIHHFGTAVNRVNALNEVEAKFSSPRRGGAAGSPSGGRAAPE